jgi:hypothetical protein
MSPRSKNKVCRSVWCTPCPRLWADEFVLAKTKSLSIQLFAIQILKETLALIKNSCGLDQCSSNKCCPKYFNLSPGFYLQFLNYYRYFFWAKKWNLSLRKVWKLFSPQGPPVSLLSLRLSGIFSHVCAKTVRSSYPIRLRIPIPRYVRAQSVPAAPANGLACTTSAAQILWRTWKLMHSLSWPGILSVRRRHLHFCIRVLLGSV